MEENTAKREVCKPFSIKMYQEDIDRFQKLASEMDNVKSNREAFNALMDFFENPKTIKVDNPELIKKNQDLQDEINELQETIASLKAELTRHQEEAQHAETQKANRPENIFEVEVHPVAFHFLKEMAAKTKKTPGYILTDLFIRDLQNPRANNLPYIVASSEIKAKLEEYKKAHPEEYRKEA
jgi:predicted nuclease with TOPRIM domain